MIVFVCFVMPRLRQWSRKTSSGVNGSLCHVQTPSEKRYGAALALRLSEEQTTWVAQFLHILLLRVNVRNWRVGECSQLHSI